MRRSRPAPLPARFTGWQQSPWRAALGSVGLSRNAGERRVRLNSQNMHRHVSVPACAALACAALMVGAWPAPAGAASYGELGRFGSAGTGHGQLKLSSGTHAFGVDATDNSVYVGDEPKKGEYRIQKLTAAGAFVAQTAPLVPPNHDGIEGIAVDPGDKRVYMLALERRSQSAAIDASEPAAGTLYAFSIEQSGEALVPAAGTSEGVLIGPSALEAQSEVLERALLSPKGIAVDPTTHDVIVLGEVDQGAPKEEEAPRVPIAFQRIHADGTLGARYVDSSEYFPEAERPNSPIVSSDGSVYVVQTDDVLAQIPSDFTSTSPPTSFIQFTPKGALEADAVAEFDAGEAAKEGGGLSFAPAGAGEGTIYAEAHIFNGIGGGAFYPGILTFTATGEEIGWTGGQSKQSGGESCTIGFAGPTYPSIAAGKEQTVFVLDPKTTHVVKFGPEGHGCPAGNASNPVASVNGTPLSASETVPTGTAVKFSSTLTEANALSVQWSFGDGLTTTVGTDEYQRAEVTHVFARGGELTVTETIHTDNLATPTIVKQTKISVSASAPPPTAVLEGPSEVTLGGGAQLGRLVYQEGGGLELIEAAQSEEATFDASASSASTALGPNQIESYHWTYGDGTSATTGSATVTHRYKKAGAYKVELTVTDALGATSEPATLTVKVNERPPEAPTGGGVATGVTNAPAPQTPASTPEQHSSTPAGHGSPSVPDARLASTSLAVSSAGTVGLDVTCPASESSCAGTVTLRTIGAVTAGAGGGPHGQVKRKAAVLTLAASTFKLAGGRQQSVKLRLSAQARTLLARAKTLRARATIVAHDPAGMSHTTRVAVTLYAQPALHRRHTR